MKEASIIGIGLKVLRQSKRSWLMSPAHRPQTEMADLFARLTAISKAVNCLF